MPVSERIFSNPVIINGMVKDWYLDFSFAMGLPIMKPRKEKRMSTAIIKKIQSAFLQSKPQENGVPDELITVTVENKQLNSVQRREE